MLINGGRGGAGALGLLWVATSIQKKLKLALVQYLMYTKVGKRTHK